MCLMMIAVGFWILSVSLVLAPSHNAKLLYSYIIILILAPAKIRMYLSCLRDTG